MPEKETPTKLEIIVGAMRIKLDKIAEVILGDPTDERNPGVMIRLDRLERSDRGKTRVMWLLGTAVLAIIGKVLLSIPIFQ